MATTLRDKGAGTPAPAAGSYTAGASAGAAAAAPRVSLIDAVTGDTSLLTLEQLDAELSQCACRHPGCARIFAYLPAPAAAGREPPAQLQLAPLTSVEALRAAPAGSVIRAVRLPRQLHPDDPARDPPVYCAEYEFGYCDGGRGHICTGGGGYSAAQARADAETAAGVLRMRAPPHLDAARCGYSDSWEDDVRSHNAFVEAAARVARAALAAQLPPPVVPPPTSLQGGATTSTAAASGSGSSSLLLLLLPPEQATSWVAGLVAAAADARQRFEAAMTARGEVLVAAGYLARDGGEATEANDGGSGAAIVVPRAVQLVCEAAVLTADAAAAVVASATSFDALCRIPGAVAAVHALAAGQRARLAHVRECLAAWSASDAAVLAALRRVLPTAAVDALLDAGVLAPAPADVTFLVDGLVDGDTDGGGVAAAAHGVSGSDDDDELLVPTASATAAAAAQLPPLTRRLAAENALLREQLAALAACAVLPPAVVTHHTERAALWRAAAAARDAAGGDAPPPPPPLRDAVLCLTAQMREAVGCSSSTTSSGAGNDGGGGSSYLRPEDAVASVLLSLDAALAAEETAGNGEGGGSRCDGGTTPASAAAAASAAIATALASSPGLAHMLLPPPHDGAPQPLETNVRELVAVAGDLLARYTQRLPLTLPTPLPPAAAAGAAAPQPQRRHPLRVGDKALFFAERPFRWCGALATPGGLLGGEANATYCVPLPPPPLGDAKAAAAEAATPTVMSAGAHDWPATAAPTVVERTVTAYRPLQALLDAGSSAVVSASGAGSHHTLEFLHPATVAALEGAAAVRLAAGAPTPSPADAVRVAVTVAPQPLVVGGTVAAVAHCVYLADGASEGDVAAALAAVEAASASSDHAGSGASTPPRWQLGSHGMTGLRAGTRFRLVTLAEGSVVTVPPVEYAAPMTAPPP